MSTGQGQDRSPGSGRTGGRAHAPLRVLGVDPGSRVTGFGLVERQGSHIAHVAHGTIRVPKSHVELAPRLAHVFDEMAAVIARYRPDVACVEQVFVSVSARSALVLGQARGAVLVALARTGVAVVEYPPALIKQSVAGNGRATKHQIQRLTRRLLGLDRLPAQDAADALAAALCHAQAGSLAALPPVSRRRNGTSRTSLRVRRAP